uniref:Bifunctional inhibitor/plant lipid transfer protein/seed storage helical domain-containing protein n=1 Tax=Leersia perrieri TaxID=77586 RepID=A0A0D9WFH6_9ORYZ
MASFQLRHVCLTVVLFSIGISSCRGQGGGGAGGGAVVPGTQDPVQIVAQAALCFDNRPVLNGCLQSMGINVTTGGTNASSSSPAAAPTAAAAANGTATMCSAPCFGQMTMMMGCVNSILGNFAGYSPGLMQGVQAIFQMSCGNVNGQPAAAAAGGGAAGGSTGAGSGGGTGSTTSVSPNSGSHVAVNRAGYPTSGAAGLTFSVMNVFSSVLIVWVGTWLMA